MADADLFPREKASDYIEARCCCGEPLTNMCAATSRRSSLWSGWGAISDQQFVFNIPAQAEHYIGGEVIMLSNRRAATTLGNFHYSTPIVISAFGLQIQYSITRNTQSGFPLSIQNASTHMFLSSGIHPRAWISAQVHLEQDFLPYGCLFGPFLCYIKEINVPISPQHHFSDPYSQTIYKATLPDYCY